MRKYGYVLLAAIVALLVSLGLATSADAKEDAQARLPVSHHVVSGPNATPAQARADQPTPAGPDRIVLLSGLVLLLAGATAVTVARRNAEEVELPGQTA